MPTVIVAGMLTKINGWERRLQNPAMGSALMADANQKRVVAARCPRCGTPAYHDITSPLFGTAHLTVSDEGCSYFVDARTYVLECEYVRGRRDGFFSATENPCPNLKRVIPSFWRAFS